jgi:hypothetical protein
MRVSSNKLLQKYEHPPSHDVMILIIGTKSFRLKFPGSCCLYRLVERTALGVSGKLVFAVQARRTVFDQASWLSSLPHDPVALYVLGRFNQAQ